MPNLEQPVMTFTEALADAREATDRRPHVLLGNGFSIACRPDRFNYQALLEEATFADARGDIPAVFELLGTTDFERVIEQLRISALMTERYGAERELVEALNSDADVVREALAQTLAERHPDLPFDIDESEYIAVRSFLSNFERIYTMNYDMLVYWAAMQDGDPAIPRNDGFSNPEDPDAPYVVWEPYHDFDMQRLFFLHGGLHLYDTGREISKITWSRTGVPLVDQIREALAEGRYPLIVTEGNTREKESRILHNAYLNHAIRSFAKIGNALFIYGHGLAENDEHILQRIERGKLRRLYVSLYGDPERHANVHIVARSEQMAATRPPSRPLVVQFFDAESAHVWSAEL